MVCLHCENLALGYEHHIVVKDISCTVNSGDYLCIVGENGAGKTTLLKTLLGLQKPLAGTITRGRDFNLRHIGYVPQQTVIQKDFPATVEEIVLSGCINRIGFAPFYSARERAYASSTMEQLGIAPLAKHSYRELSGGQQQRVLLARALCATHTMLFLDEPTAGLDPTATEDLYALIQQCNRDGLTIVMITHDMNAALRYASHILHVGKQNFFGSKDEYVRSIYHG